MIDTFQYQQPVGNQLIRMVGDSYMVQHDSRFEEMSKELGISVSIDKRRLYQPSAVMKLYSQVLPTPLS